MDIGQAREGSCTQNRGIRQLEVLLELPECSRLYLCAKIFKSIQGSALSASWTSELNKAKGTAQ